MRVPSSCTINSWRFYEVFSIQKGYTFAVVWLFICFVSVWDGYLTLLNRYVMDQEELNPVGRVLIELDAGGVSYLLIAKVIGTILAASILLVLYQRNRLRGLGITAVVAAVQLCLLLFLSIA